MIKEDIRKIEKEQRDSDRCRKIVKTGVATRWNKASKKKSAWKTKIPSVDDFDLDDDEDFDISDEEQEPNLENQDDLGELDKEDGHTPS